MSGFDRTVLKLRILAECVVVCMWFIQRRSEQLGLCVLVVLTVLVM